MELEIETFTAVSSLNIPALKVAFHQKLNPDILTASRFPYWFFIYLVQFLYIQSVTIRERLPPPRPTNDPSRFFSGQTFYLNVLIRPSEGLSILSAPASTKPLITNPLPSPLQIHTLGWRTMDQGMLHCAQSSPYHEPLHRFHWISQECQNPGSANTEESSRNLQTKRKLVQTWVHRVITACPAGMAYGNSSQRSKLITWAHSSPTMDQKLNNSSRKGKQTKHSTRQPNSNLVKLELF